MTTDTPEPEPLHEWFRVVYANGTVVDAFYPGGATLREAVVGHPSARVEVMDGEAAMDGEAEDA